MSMKYIEFYEAVKVENFIENFLMFLDIFVQNIDRQGSCDEYPQPVFWIKNKKTVYPVNPICTI